MRFSIIIPVYKTEAYIRPCMESVLKQTYTDFEVILVDDGSPDACPAICDDFHKQDVRVNVIHQENSGPGVARNAGIEAAQGEYLLFLDSDDYWIKDSVLDLISSQLDSCELAVFDMQKLTNGVLGPPAFDCYRAFRENYATGESFLRAVLEQQPLFCWYFWRFVFKRSLFSDRALRFSNQKWCEDTALLYRVILKAKETRMIKDSFYAYRQDRPDSASRTVTYNTLHTIMAVAEQEIQRVQSMSGLSGDVRELLCRNLSKEFFAAISLSPRLPASEQGRLWDELERCRWMAKYGKGKERIKALLIQLLGVRRLASILGVKQKLQIRI